MARITTVLLVLVAFVCPRAHAEEPLSTQWPGIQKLFTEMREVVRTKDGDKLVALMDMEAAANEILVDVKPNDGWRRGFISGFASSIKGVGNGGRFLFDYESFEIRRVTRVNATRVEAYVRFRQANGLREKVMFNLAKHGTGWRFYDYFFVDGGVRFTLAARAAATQAIKTGPLPAWIGRGRELGSATRILREGDFAGGLKLLLGLKDVAFPTDIRASVWSSISICHAGLGDYVASATAAEKAHALVKEQPMAHYLRAVAYNELERYGDALKHGLRYGELLDLDAEVLLEIGIAQWGLGEDKAAIATWREGYKDDPTNPETLKELVLALPSDAKAEFAPAITAHGELIRLANSIGAEAYPAGDEPALRLVVDALVAKFPAHADRFYYEGLLLTVQAKFKDAAKALQRGMAALPKDIDDAERAAFFDHYLVAMTKAGDVVEAWKETLDPGNLLTPTSGFTRIADILLDDKQLSEDKQIERLDALLGAASIIRPDVRTQYKAELQYARGQYDDVRKTLKPLVAKLQKEAPAKYLPKFADAWRHWELLWRVEERYFRACFKRNDLDSVDQLATLQETRDEDLTFRVLWCIRKGNAARALRLMEDYDLWRLGRDEDIQADLKRPELTPLRDALDEK